MRFLVGGLALFIAQDAENGRELWSSRGTPDTTTVIDLNPGPDSSSPHSFCPFGGRIYFADGTTVWATDGTPEGTVPVMQVTWSWAGTPIVIGRMIELGGRLLIELHESGRYSITEKHVVLYSELWSSDGTAQGTRLAILPDAIRDVAVAGTRAVLTFFEGGTWATDGAGWVPIRSGRADDLTACGSRVLCRYDDGSHGPELWATDGTLEGTALVKDIRPGADGADPWSLAAFGGSVFFSADDGVDGCELWMSDGTAAGTRMVTDLNPGPAGCNPYSLTPVGDRLFFVARDATGVEGLWYFTFDETGTFRRGDANSDGSTDLTDAIAIFGHLFLGEPSVPCEQAADTDDDGSIEITDAVYLLSFLFMGGKPIEPPVGDCGVDPTGHSIPCAASPGCP